MKTSDGLHGLVSHYNQRVAAIAAKLSTYQITQERKVSLFPDRGPPSYFSKDWVFQVGGADIHLYSANNRGSNWDCEGLCNVGLR